MKRSRSAKIKKLQALKDAARAAGWNVFPGDNKDNDDPR